MTNIEKALSILEHEFDMEMKVAKKMDKMLHSTLNPIKRFRLSRLKKSFIDHAVGINLVMNKIKREVKDLE